MGLTAWIFWFALDSAWAYWVVCRGGATWVEGWRALPLIGFWAAHWEAEQIRLYVLLLWVVHALWFVLGLWQPAWRF